MNPLNTTVTSRLGRILLAVMASGYLLIGPISLPLKRLAAQQSATHPLRF
jgi:hypothetical protein